MNRLHDMGGRYGDGPVPDTDDSVVFHSDWEAHAMAVTVLSATVGAWNIDASRHARESLAPKDYTRFSYYERWMAGLADLLVARGVVTADELAQAAPAEPADLQPSALRAQDIPASQNKRAPYSREIDRAPQFKSGDAVRSVSYSPNVAVPGGHSRLPRYAMGRVGTIEVCHGAHVLPDSNAHFLGEAPEPLYTVAFRAEELWGSAAKRPHDTIMLDLWESYLSPVA